MLPVKLGIGLLLVVGSIPVAIIGLLFETQIELAFELPALGAVMLMVTGAVLTIGERIGKLTREIPDMTPPHAVLIGLGQALAVLPGLSRSGTTISAARALHMKRAEAARFSFMLSAPAILGAGILQVVEVLQAGLDSVNMPILLAGLAASAISSYGVIHWLLGYLRRHSTLAFAAYCAVAGLLSLGLVVLRGQGF